MNDLTPIVAKLTLSLGFLIKAVERLNDNLNKTILIVKDLDKRLAALESKNDV